MSREKRILSIDLETTGASVHKNGILSIGYCVGKSKYEILHKGRLSMHIDTYDFEQRCIDQFWSKNKDVLNKLITESRPIVEQMEKFSKMVDELDDQYEVHIISDNVQFDIGFLNVYYAKYLNRNPISYTAKGEYRAIYDTDSYSRGLLKMDYTNPWVYDSVLIEKYKLTIENKQTHYPDDDAAYIYEFHVKLIDACNRQL